jgi:predicted PurR-regulated permease PerM
VALSAVVPVWLLALPGALELYLDHYPLLAVFFLLSHVTVSSILDPIILTERDPHIPSTSSHGAHLHPYLIGLSVYGGLYVTGNLTGVLMGPLVVSLLVIATRHLSLSQVKVNATPAPSVPASRAPSPSPSSSGADHINKKED